MANIPRRISRNIFHYATSELSQDAMIAWLISCATAADTALSEVGRAFLRFLLQTDLHRDGTVIEKAVIGPDNEIVTYDGPGNASEILDLESQHRHIDVYCRAEIDGRKISFVIEDKAHTTDHSHQLPRYRQLVQRDDIEEDYLKLIYLKTGMPYETEKARVAAQGFSFVGIHDFAAFLDSKPSSSAHNALVTQIREHVLSMRDAQDDAKKNWEMHLAPIQERFLKRLQERTNRVESDLQYGRNRGGAGHFTKLMIEHRHRSEWALFWRIDATRPLRLMIYRGWKKDREVKEENARLMDHYRPFFDQAVEEVGGLRSVRSSRRRAFEPAIGAVAYPGPDEMEAFLDRVAAVHARFLELAEL